jgi:dienelactone hydrolase
LIFSESIAMPHLLFAVLCALSVAAPRAAAPAPRDIKTETVEYRDGDVVLEGYLAYDPAVSAKRPGVMVVHEWKGHGPYARRRAEMLAREGYVAFACDMYGKGVFAKDHEEAAALAGVYFKDRSKMRARAAAGLAVLKNKPFVDAERLAVMGYCFGGTTSLECARAGFGGVRGVASFHGNLSAPEPASAQTLKAKIAVFHGADDAGVAKGIPAFEAEMRAAKADWQFTSYGGAVHSFTVPEAGNDPAKGAAYDEKADRRSWAALLLFLKECFAAG